MSEQWKEKPRFDWIPPEVMREVARIFAFGGEKYAPHDWKGRPPEYFEAKVMRHWNEYQMGATRDEDTGRHPLAHMITDTIMLLSEIMREGNMQCSSAELTEALDYAEDLIVGDE